LISERVNVFVNLSLTLRDRKLYNFAVSKVILLLYTKIRCCKK